MRQPNHIATNEIEMGLGIHGETGAERSIYQGAKQTVSDAVAKLGHPLNGGKYAALLNDLGRTKMLEMSVWASVCVREILVVSCCTLSARQR